MFSKWNLGRALLAAVLGTSMVLTACDSKVGEEPPPATNQEFSGTACLSAVSPVIKSYLEGTATQRDIEAGWDCAGSAVEKFKRYVRGSSSDRYTSQELSTFLEKNFLKDEKISPALQVEFMKLKQLFVGGSNEYLTRAEIDKLIILFENFSDISVRLNPYMKVLVLNWNAGQQANTQENLKYFEQANEEIQNAARSIAALIEKNGRGYLLSDFVTLTKELSAFFGESWEFPAAVEKYMPIVQKVKKALAGGDENSIVPSEWAKFLLLGSRAYVQYLRYHYFIATSTEANGGFKLSYIAASAEDILSIFQDFVAEKPLGKVTTQELSDLLSKLSEVWPTFKTSDKLLLESMKIKQLLFGGDVTDFTTKDFENARGKVAKIKAVTEKFLPYYSVYSGDWDPSLYGDEEAEKFFKDAMTSLEAVAKEASMLFETSYDLKNLTSLLDEVERLYPPQKGHEGLSKSVKKYVPVIVDTKNMIFSTNDSVLRKEHWSVLATIASRAYGDYLYYKYFVSDKPDNEVRTVVAQANLSNMTLNLVKDLLAQKKEGYFSKSELTKLIAHLSNLGMLPKNFTPDIVSRLLDVVLNRVLISPERRLDGYSPNVLNASAVEVARQELQIYLDTRAWLVKQTAGMKPNDGYRASRMIELLENAKASKNSSSALKIGAGELLLAVSSPVPMTVDSAGRLNISNHEVHYYTAKSLDQLNLNRVIARIFMRSFVNSRSRLANYSGANLAEVEGAFKTLRPVLIRMGLIEDNNTTFASSRFREANIFVPHSDGNDLVSFTEGVDLVGMIWSGLNINTKLKAQLLKDCFGGRSQVSNSAKVPVSCARSSYRNSFPRAAASMPEFVRFVEDMPSGMWVPYIENVFKAAGYVPNPKNLAMIGDISLSPHVIQYIEMIFARFDKNRDDYISTEEAIKAFPAFRGILHELAKDQLDSGTIKEENLIDVFGYILRYGHPPTSIGEKLQFVFNWKGKQEKWDIWAGRAQLSEILGYIADEVAKANAANRPVKMNFNLEGAEKKP